MLKKIIIMALVLMLIVFLAPSVFGSYGTNITIFDGMKGYSSNPTNNAWWNTNNEDQEVEPYNDTGQRWDLEGFFLNGTNLSVISGFNLKNGYGSYKIGDIFIDTNGQPNYGYPGTGHTAADGIQQYANVWGYNYAITLDFNTNSYMIYEINNQTMLDSVYLAQNKGANPWKLVSTDGLSSESTGSFTYSSGLTNNDTGFLGDGLTGSHYALSNIDISSSTGHGTGAYYHITEQCGNDSLMGNTPKVPEAGTMLLFGTGLLALAGFRRFLKK